MPTSPPDTSPADQPPGGSRVAADAGGLDRRTLDQSGLERRTTDQRALDPGALGQRIASLRHASGWSQRRLAEAAGVSHGYIALLELGRLPSPGKFRLDAVARALNLRTSDALTNPSLDRRAETETASGQEGVAASSGAAGGQGGVAARSATASGQAASTTLYAAGERPATPTTPTATTTTTQSGSGRADFSVGNVVGRLEQLRVTDARPLPVFRWGACGDPRDQESGPDPDRLEYPPPGRETLIGPNGFGVVVKGDSMAGRGIYDGDVVWVNPERPYAVGKVVLALVSDVGGESAGMVVKTYARTEVGDCLLSETAAGRSPVVCSEFRVIGPVVGITSWRLPG
ncbi:MAG: helix-turn-helix domain-containing protein [Chloroflexi bacterium]|nr:helix-turn-helix domain-containing protein [Chloroflexota bacterium]